ncbi:MAG: PEGA domain-containing protein [Kofleriaceae bacterium]|nr:PEGA domain-containing protein [Kofleriaceae bacterium]
MRALVAWIVAAALALAPPLASSARADATEDAALLHLDRGIAAFKAGDLDRARAEFQAAHDLVPDRANPYRWLALTEVQLGDCVAAARDADGFLARVAADDPRAAELVRVRDLCGKTGVLAIDSAPTGASLRIDDALVGRTPHRALAMRAGEHTVAADLDGYASTTRRVVVPAGGELAVHLTLRPRRRSLVTRWWFWTAVVGAAAVTATIAVVATRGPDETLLPPVTCERHRLRGATP